MKKFIENLKNVSDANKILKQAIIILLIGTIILNISLFIYCFSVISKSKQEIYVLTKDGKSISAELMNISEKRDIEAIAMSKMFIYLFFELDKWNYEQKINESFKLGGKCIVELYSKFKNDEWFKKLTQYNIIQTVTIEKVYNNTQSSPYSVTCEFKVKIITELTQDPTYYSINMILSINESIGSQSRTEANPYALMINNIEITKFAEITNN